MEEMLDNWYINLLDWNISITDLWKEKVKWLNEEMWNMNSNKRISLEFESQISTLKEGEIYVPQESEIDF